MYVIIAYDVNVERVNKVKAFLRKYLTWVQNSLLEGEITEAQMMEIKNGIKRIIDETQDSIVFYILENNKVIERETLGIKKGDPDQVIL